MRCIYRAFKAFSAASSVKNTEAWYLPPLEEPQKYVDPQELEPKVYEPPHVISIYTT